MERIHKFSEKYFAHFMLLALIVYQFSYIQQMESRHDLELREAHRLAQKHKLRADELEVGLDRPFPLESGNVIE